MRKLSCKRANWLKTITNRANKRLVRRAGFQRHHILRTGIKLAVRAQTSVIRVPQSLASETEELRIKIQECVLHAMDELKKGKRVRFDFTSTKRAFPGGMLMLLAYVELMLEYYPTKISASAPQGALITQLLQHFGFAGRLGVNCGGTKPSHESVRHWRFLTGTQADGEKITDLLNAYKSVSGSEIPEGLYDVLAEALTNVRHHAYPKNSEETPVNLRKWWLFARYTAPTDGKLGSLYVAVYDIGIGIQESLRKKLKTGEIILDKADDLLGALKLGDANIAEKVLLRRAIEEPRSSTGLSFRGNGLPEMKDFVMGTDSGRMYITSGRAQYTCIAQTKKSEVFGCKAGLPGTLIVWAIPLGASQKEQ